MQTTIDIEREIKNFIIREFLAGEASSLNPEGVLLGDTIDSMGVLTLVGFIQDHFQISISDDEVRPENLDTIETLVAFVAKKMSV